MLINDLCYNILILIEEEKTFECLFNELLPCFSSEISKDKEQTYKLILTEVEYLLYHGVICIDCFQLKQVYKLIYASKRNDFIYKH